MPDIQNGLIESIKKPREGKAFIKITPEVSMDSRVLYLVRINGVEMTFVNSKEEAKLVVDSLAAELSREIENKHTEVYRKDSADGTKVIISKQDLGSVFNSAIYQVKEIDFLPVGHSILSCGRHELPSIVVTAANYDSESDSEEEEEKK